MSKTGQFNYTFEVPKNLKVVPESYAEFMMFLDARRRYKSRDSPPHSLAGEKESVMG